MMFARAFNSPKVSWDTLPKRLRSNISPTAVLGRHTLPQEADWELLLVVKELAENWRETL